MKQVKKHNVWGGCSLYTKYNCAIYFPTVVRIKTIPRREGRETNPRIRNCPGAGRPNGTESFSTARRDGQLSTKLDTGILGQKQGTVMF